MSDAQVYLNQGHSPSVIVAPLYIASGYVSLVLKAPATASKLKSRFMRLDKSYQTVFSETVPLGVWPVIGHILKKTDAVLEKERPIGTAANDFFVRNPDS